MRMINADQPMIFMTVCYCIIATQAAYIAHAVLKVGTQSAHTVSYIFV